MPDMTLTFFDLEDFGFYQHGTRDLLFGDLRPAMRELHDWSAGKDVGMTELASPSRLYRGALPVYVFGMQSVGDDWLLATWNTVPAADGKVASLARDSRVGRPPTVHDNPVVEGSIPGFPTYFWFVPQHNAFATLRFENPITAARPMLGYVKQFLKTESGYVVKDEDDKIVGYRDLNGEGDHTKAHVKVTANVRSKPGEVARLRRERVNIRTVIRDSYLIQRVRRDRSWFQILSQRVRDSEQASELTQDTKVHIAMNYTPTAEELEQMIQTELNTDRETEYDDLGFKLAGSSETIWINSAMSRNTVNVNLQIPANGVVPVRDLAEVLAARRREFLRGI